MKLKRPTNEDSFAEVETIITAEMQSLYRYACYRLGEREAAQDVIQELYLKLIKSPAKFSEIQDPAAFGITILRNICIDIIRRREKRKSEELHEYII